MLKIIANFLSRRNRQRNIRSPRPVESRAILWTVNGQLRILEVHNG